MTYVRNYAIFRSIALSMFILKFIVEHAKVSKLPQKNKTKIKYFYKERRNILTVFTEPVCSIFVVK